MKVNVIGIVICLFVTPIFCAVPVLIDTDMGLDDARAIVLMLQSPQVDVRAIVTSDGAAEPRYGYENIKRILDYLGHSNIVVGMGRPLNAPPWREKSNTLGWAHWPESLLPSPTYPSTQEVLGSLTKQGDKLTYVCLGPLTNLSHLLQASPQAVQRIDRVLYFGGLPDANDPGWNTQRDILSARRVFDSGLSVWAFSIPQTQLLPFDLPLYQEICRRSNKAAQLIRLLHQDPRVQALFGTRHSKIWDEMLALYLHDPNMVSDWITNASQPVHIFQTWDQERARALYIDLLSH